MYLRIVLTNLCNVACYFCHKEGSELGRIFSLPLDYILKSVQAATQLGITTFKFTGGEPLVYNELPHLIKAIKRICPNAEISLTTNGLLLEKKLPDLLAAGLTRINVSLQTLDPVRYREIMKSDSLETVLKGIDLLAKSGTDSKICSAFSKRNEDEILQLARWSKSLGLGYRVHNLLPVLEEAVPDVIPIEEIERRISQFPGATRLDIKKNGKHRLIFKGSDWEIMVPNWRHWKRCGNSNCPLNDNVKRLCKEGEVFSVRLTQNKFQTCLMGSRKNFSYFGLSDIAGALRSASHAVRLQY